MAHPPRSNPALRSSSDPPRPCITPSTEMFVFVVSFMVPFLSLVVLSSDPDGRTRRSHRSWHDPCGGSCRASAEQGPHVGDVVVGDRHREHGLGLLEAGGVAAGGSPRRPTAQQRELLPLFGRLDAGLAPSPVHLRFPPRSAAPRRTEGCHDGPFRASRLVRVETMVVSAELIPPMGRGV